MNRIRRDTLLGLVFFGSLAFLLWATVNLTDLAVDNERLIVRFDQAGSAEVGTNVMVLGKKIGKVGFIDVAYDQPKPVQMTLLLREAIPMRDGYQIVVRDQGVLGGKQVYIDPGRGPTLLPLRGTTFDGVIEPGAFEQIGNIAKGEGKLGGRLDYATEQFGKFFANMNNPETTIGRLTNSRELHDSLLGATDKANRALQAVVDGQGAIGHLVMNEATKENVRSFVADLREISQRLLSTDQGVLGVLLNDRETATNAKTILANIDKIVADATAGKGLVGRVLRDEEMARQFVDVVANLDKLLANLTNPEAGAFGALTSDPQTAADIKMTIANLRIATDELTRQDSLLGMLITDKELGTRFRRILTQVSRALEDAREAAPIANFVQVLLGAF